MDNPMREMTLDEWVERLPETHRARAELTRLRRTPPREGGNMTMDNTRIVSADCRLERWESHYMSDYHLHEKTKGNLNPCWNHNYYKKDGEDQTTYFNRQNVLMTHTNHVEVIEGPFFSCAFESGGEDHRKAVRQWE